MKVACIVQARMTSRRFPGKVMEPLLGKPVLFHVLSRCKLIDNVDVLVCAYPDAPASRPIADLCQKMGVTGVPGDENDVLGRYYKAAKLVEADLIMRITGDCPFIDPYVCSIVLARALDGGYDYTSNVFPERTFPKGLDCEVFTFQTLEMANEKATLPGDREHVTPWMQQSEEIGVGCVKSNVDSSHYDLCIDRPHDISRLEKEIMNAIKR